MKNHRFLPMTLIAVAVLAGCNSLPASNSLLDQARSDYSNAQASPQVTGLAAGELKQASDSLDRANNAWTKREDRALVDHLAYVAKQQVAIAQETARQKTAELAVANASAERDSVRLDARTREAESAQRSAEYSQRQSEASQRSADESRRSAEVSQQQAITERQAANDAQMKAEGSRRSAEISQQQAVTERLAANDAQQNAQAARQQTQDAENRSRQLEAQLKELEAKKTDRGMVITLGDVLFDTNKSQLKSGGMRNVQKLADFFKQYPQRKVMIEGFTDSTGSDSRNQVLSDQRADSVRIALLGMGMGADRITSRGYGESYPIAGNNTAAGRQLNRRVEVIVSDDNGNIAPR
jgi:outer membrane protein OmpA-like peptidoglycan-associated protein